MRAWDMMYDLVRRGHNWSTLHIMLFGWSEEHIYS